MTRAAGVQRNDSAKLLERLFDDGSSLGLSETQLVERFAADRDESAFAALVDRHGAMVLGVCRRFLRDPNDVDDAFQAVFLVLARKAGGLREKDLLANWLYGVALRVAVRSRASAARRAASDPGGRLETDARKPTNALPVEALARREDEAKLHEEVGRLPTRYRAPVVACYFEGRTHEEAAAYLGCPVGTVKGRLARARDLLKRRLERRGVVAPAALMTYALASPDLRAAVPPALAARTVATSLALTASPAAWMTAAALSTPARSLAQGVIQAMCYSQLKLIAIPTLLVGAAFVVGGASLAATWEKGVPQEEKMTSTVVKAVEERPTSVRPMKPKAPPAGEDEADQPDPGPQTASTPNAAGGGGGFDGGGMGGPTPDQIRQDIAGLSAAIGKVDEDPNSKAVRDFLDRPFTLRAGENAHLSELLAQIKKVPLGEGKKLPVYVDPVGLEDVGATLESPVSIDLEDVPLRFSLRVALKQLGLAYCVRDGVLVVSSIDGVQQELLEAQKEMIGLHPDKVIYGPNGPYLHGMGGGMGGSGGFR